MDELLSILRNTIGLDANSIGIGSVERAVQRRIEATKSSHLALYRQLLKNSPSELSALIETVVVPETWFFRDPGAFGAVAREAARRGSDTQLRYLCVPCSSGEEPYSLAISLLEAGVSPERFHIEAIDVSRRVIEEAARAVYGRNSFRGRDLGFRDRYFKATPEGHVLDPAVRRMVAFRQANLLSESALPGSEVYHAIFCRNLLIYFDEPMQERAIRTLRRLLRSDGLLCVAPAESAVLLRYGLAPARLPMAFAFRKEQTAIKPPRPPKPARSKPALAQTKPTEAAPRKAQKPGTAPVEAPSATPGLSLEKAYKLADEGRYDEVTAICAAIIKAGNAPADAYYLLALVNDATGKLNEAAEHYRKALYLDPKHKEALAHFSLLATRMGDLAAAQSLEARARRLDVDAA